MPEREHELFEQYQTPGTAEHYATGRWQQSRRARRSSAQELKIVKQFCQQIGPLANILDIPCGTGRFSQLLGEFAEQVVRADLSSAMLGQVAVGKGTSKTNNLQASAAAIPFANSAFDLAFCFRLLHHFELPEQRIEVLSELARVSRRWVIGTFFDSSSFQAWRNRVRGKVGTRYPQSIASIHAEAAAAGLRVKEMRFLSKKISEQMVVLLEKVEHQDEVILDLPSVCLERRSLSNRNEYAHKRYFFPNTMRRLGAAHRHTWRKPCRAQQEYQNLVRLEQLAVPVVKPTSWWCQRDAFGFVRDSGVISQWCDAPNAEQVSAEHLADWLIEHETNLRESIAKIHGAGCLYRGLHPRNLLLSSTGPRWLDPAKCHWFRNPKQKKFLSAAAAEERNFWQELNS